MMEDEYPSTEEEIRARICRIGFRLRHTRSRIKQANEDWMTLVAERIELEDRLRLFEVSHAENLA